MVGQPGPVKTYWHTGDHALKDRPRPSHGIEKFESLGTGSGPGNCEHGLLFGGTSSGSERETSVVSDKCLGTEKRPTETDEYYTVLSVGSPL